MEATEKITQLRTEVQQVIDHVLTLEESQVLVIQLSTPNEVRSKKTSLWREKLKYEQSVQNPKQINIVQDVRKCTLSIHWIDPTKSWLNNAKVIDTKNGEVEDVKLSLPSSLSDQAQEIARIRKLMENDGCSEEEITEFIAANFHS